MASPTTQRKLQKARRLLQEGHPRQAADLCRMVVEREPDTLPAWRLLGRCLQRLGDLEGALEAARGAVRAKPNNVDAALRLAECLVLNGDTQAALEEARRIKATAAGRKGALLRTGRFLESCGRDEEALHSRLAALQAAPDDPECIADLMESFLQRDEGEQLERLADRLVFLEPERHVALVHRALARRQTHEDNHVRNLAWLLDQLPDDHAGRVPLAYALAKEWEDLDHFDEAFYFLQVASDARREAQNSDIEAAEAQMAQLVEAFPGQAHPAEPESLPGEGIVFIVGLPGAGTCWLEQNLSSHPHVGARGDNSLLALSAMRLGLYGPSETTGDETRFQAMGTAFRDSLGGLGDDEPWLLDRTTDQHLYLGLAVRALPGARVIHLVRRPMDQAFSLFRRYFPQGRGWSHHQEHVARYVVAYRRLMAHWQSLWPGEWLELAYADVVDWPQAALGRTAGFLGLDATSLPDATFNAQGPLAARAGAVSRWKSYRRQLGPMMQIFKDRDLPLE